MSRIFLRRIPIVLFGQNFWSRNQFKEDESMNLKPLGDRLVIEPLEQQEQTASGIFLPETAKEKPQEGKVIAAGPGARKESGERITMDVNVGDTVLYAKYSGTNVKLNGKEYLILKENDVLAIVLNGQS
jgi:chaperonin GroES